MIRGLVIAMLAVLASPAFAQNEVKVEADTFIVDQNKSSATFSGHVVVTRSDLTVWADEVVVKYGAGGTQQIESFTAVGSVRLKTASETATGARATFNPKTQIMTLSGNVTVTNSAGSLNGPELVLNLAKQTTTFSSGGGGGRVTGVFTPQ
jgi:lipopolysaccharide export system protein LptA